MARLTCKLYYLNSLNKQFCVNLCLVNVNKKKHSTFPIFKDGNKNVH